MVDLEREFSVGTLNICDLAIRVRYRRCTDDTFRTANEVSCYLVEYRVGFAVLCFCPSSVRWWKEVAKEGVPGSCLTRRHPHTKRVQSLTRTGKHTKGCCYTVLLLLLPDLLTQDSTN